MAGRTIDMEALHQKLKQSSRAPEMGMIASHRGLVRATSRGGASVGGLSISFNPRVVADIVESIKKRPGIVEVLVEYSEGDLNIGDDVMVVLVAGDIRENVFPALVDAVDELKARAAVKEEQLPAG